MSNHLYDHLFARHARNDACFLQRDGVPSLRYADFLGRAAQIAHVLRDAGLDPGARVVVQAPKCVEMIALYAATLQAGGVFLPLNTAYTHEEVAYFVEDAKPKLLVCDPGSTDRLAEVADAVGATRLTLDAAGLGTLTAAAHDKPAQFDTVPRRPDDLAALLYTSGTTGRSKGAMLTHENLLSNARTLTELWQITDADRLIHALPIFHTHGLFVALNTSICAGASVHLLPAFSVDAIIAALPRATLLMGVPTYYTRLLADDRLTRDLTATMRLFISGSAPLLAETHAAFTRRTGHRILERYGMTETNMNTSNPYHGDRRAGTVGKPLPGVDVMVTDPDTGEELPRGEVGMIEVRGPNVFKGYWQQPDKTAAELRETGYFITGDLGRIDEDGYLTIVGRSKDLIIRGGYNVYPKEIEDVLNDSEGVEESAVFGIPDSDFGEAIVAAVVMLPGRASNVDELENRVRARLARFKHPRFYAIVDALPRNAMGKVQKTVLRASYLRAHGR
jgi:malonyl-CoA/methylmalonyl-CoA synthetase